MYRRLNVEDDPNLLRRYSADVNLVKTIQSDIKDLEDDYDRKSDKFKRKSLF